MKYAFILILLLFPVIGHTENPHGPEYSSTDQYGPARDTLKVALYKQSGLEAQVILAKQYGAREGTGFLKRNNLMWIANPLFTVGMIIYKKEITAGYKNFFLDIKQDSYKLTWAIQF